MLESQDVLMRPRALAEGVAAVGLALGLGVALELGLGFHPGASLQAVLPLLWLGATVAPHHQEHGQVTLGPANRLTLLRGVWVGGLAASLLEPVSGLWLALAGAVAFGLDWLDGQVARRTCCASPFGARLDMELDAITVLVLSALVWDQGVTGPWVLASGALRYLFVAAALVWPWMSADLPPSERRRVVCGVQVSCLLVALVPWPWAWLGPLSAAFGLVALLASFGADTWWLWRATRR